MVNAAIQVRTATRADERQINDLLYFDSQAHRHLDWRGPLEWLGDPYYWVLEENGRVNAVLACPQDPPGIAWMRLFAHGPHLSGPEAWSPLWETARTEIVSRGGAIFAVISLQDSFQKILRDSNFTLLQNIVMLVWEGKRFIAPPLASEFRIRRMDAADLPDVVEVDRNAFDPLWHNSQHALQRAHIQSLYSTVVEWNGKVVGYQISTGNPRGAHLARLAVRNDAQSRGLGSALMSDLISQLGRRGISRLSVNTQEDNAVSLSLYEKIGFIRTGEKFPVLIHRG